jgi:uncharacterized protein YecE (DUF72 family)
MKKHAQLWIGCSGFYNRHWKGIFYPEQLPQSKWFAYYSSRFNTLELNTTFYKFPTAQSLHKWYSMSPPGFAFAVKAPKLITHFKKFKECDRQIGEFYVACEQGLMEKLGCVLFQLPPQVQYSEERLEHILCCLKPGFTNVIEFRHKSWWTKKVYDELTRHQVIFCSVSHPALPDTLIANMPTIYVRIHGVPRMFYSDYSEADQQKLIAAIEKKAKVKEGFVFFNNTAGDAGILNAVQFQKMILPQPVPGM